MIFTKKQVQLPDSLIDKKETTLMNEISFDIPDCNNFLVDIDGTLTSYKSSVTHDKLLHGNFLFPVIRDMMLERGWKQSDAESAILELTEKVVYWDYTDFLAEFHLPADEAFRRMYDWHMENLIPCEDGVELVKTLHLAGKRLFIMSNNPYMGCVLKLQAAGLADDDFSTPYFKRIFGTNILRGCKCVIDVWLRVLANIPVAPSEICVIGDNPKEDRDLPRACGIGHHILLERETIQHGVENTGKTI